MVSGKTEYYCQWYISLGHTSTFHARSLCKCTVNSGIFRFGASCKYLVKRLLLQLVLHLFLVLNWINNQKKKFNCVLKRFISVLKIVENIPRDRTGHVDKMPLFKQFSNIPVQCLLWFKAVNRPKITSATRSNHRWGQCLH